MTTTEYLQREIRRTELSIRRAERKPNTPPEELRGLHEKLEHLRTARAAVGEHWQRGHDERGWMPRIDREKWEPCEECERRNCDNCKYDDLLPSFEPCKSCYNAKQWKPAQKFCPWCGRPLTDEAWAELERRLIG